MKSAGHRVLLWPTGPALAPPPLLLHQDSHYNNAAAVPRGQEAGVSSSSCTSMQPKCRTKCLVLQTALFPL